MKADGKIWLHVRVGFYEPDIEDGHDPSPFVLGAIDYGSWEVMEQEDEDKHWRDLADQFLGPEAGSYVWRDVAIGVSRTELRQLISVTQINAVVNDVSG